MRVNAFVPVKEAFHIDLVADLEVLNCGVNISGVVAEIRLNGEGVGVAVDGNVEVRVVAVLTGAVPLVEVSNVVAVSVLAGSFNGHALEGNELVLMVDKLVGS